MLVIVWRLLVSIADEVRMGVIMWSRRRILGVRRIDCSVRAVMLMLVNVRMLVCVSVRMAVRHFTVGVDVVMFVLVGVNMFMRVRLDRLIDGRHRVPPGGGVMANNRAHD